MAHFALNVVVPLLLLRRSARRVVFHFHGPWADEGTVAGDRNLVAVAKHVVERLTYARCDRFVVLSDAFAEVLRERYRVDPRKIVKIRPGVDVDAFSPSNAHEDRSEPAFAVCARRLTPRMGIDDLIRAWARVSPVVNLLIAGDGAERMSLQLLIDELGLQDRVKLLGRVTDQELQRLYADACFSVVPTRDLEGFGLVVLESLASGTPVLASSVQGLTEAMGPFAQELTFTPGDIDALAGMIATCLNDPTMLPSAEACREYAETFSWYEAAGEAMGIYEGRTDTHKVGTGREATDRRLRIAFVDHTASTSGAELALVRLLKNLTNVDAHVILAEDGELVAMLQNTGARVHILPMAARTRSLRKGSVRPGGIPLKAIWDTVAYSFRLRSFLRELRPDVVHTNSMKAGLYGCLAARLAHTKCVWHVRDRISADYLPKPAVLMIRTLLRILPNAVVANSEATLATARTSGSVVPSLVELNHSALVDRGERPGDEFAFGIVGRIATWKGQDVVLKAFAKAFPNGKERLSIVGAPLFGEDDYLLELRDLADRLGIGERVVFQGHVDPVFEALREVDALVHASVVPEPFGQVIVEGMAMALPVIATSGGGPSEIIDDGVNGLLYDAGDVEELARLMKCVRDDGDLRNTLGSNASARAADFGPDVVIPRLRTVYAALSKVS